MKIIRVLRNEDIQHSHKKVLDQEDYFVGPWISKMINEEELFLKVPSNTQTLKTVSSLSCFFPEVFLPVKVFVLQTIKLKSPFVGYN